MKSISQQKTGKTSLSPYIWGIKLIWTDSKRDRLGFLFLFLFLIKKKACEILL
jgi:hypothetical protein